MRRFEEPEIKVVSFATPDVITTSGYTDNETIWSGDWTYNNVTGGNDGDIPL